MKHLFFIVISVLACSCLACSAQTTYGPQILILSPNDFTFDPALQKEVDLKTDELKKMAAQASQTLSKQNGDLNKQPPNIKLIQQSSIDFLQHIDFAKQISIIAQQFLVYRFYEKFPNCLILVRDE